MLLIRYSPAARPPVPPVPGPRVLVRAA